MTPTLILLVFFVALAVLVAWWTDPLRQAAKKTPRQSRFITGKKP